MDKSIDTTCEHIRIRLIAAAAGLQECTKTAANIVPLPGTDRFVAIGTLAAIANVLPQGACASCTCADGEDCPSDSAPAEASSAQKSAQGDKGGDENG